VRGIEMRNVPYPKTFMFVSFLLYLLPYFTTTFNQNPTGILLPITLTPRNLILSPPYHQLQHSQLSST